MSRGRSFQQRASQTILGMAVKLVGRASARGEIAMPQQFCKIQSFLLEQRVRDWKGFLCNHHKTPPCQHCQKRWSWVSGPLQEPALSLLPNGNNTEEVAANSSATINCFLGHFFSSKGKLPSSLGFLARRAFCPPIEGRSILKSFIHSFIQ